MGFGSVASYKRLALPIQSSAPKQPLRHPTACKEAPTIVRSGKSEERRLKRMRASSKRSKKVKDPKVSAVTRWGWLKGPSKSRNRPFIARNEAQMAEGVKEIADLEKVRLKLEGEIGHSASYARWAKAAGIDQKTLVYPFVNDQEVTPDASIKSPDAIITRQHMNNDIMELLESLETRERQVILLRYGLIDGRCKSFGEIAKLSCVTKEWIRKIERTALSKICKDDIRRELKSYLNYRD